MFVIYNKKSTRLIGGSMFPKRFKTMRGAKGYLTRILNRGIFDPGIRANEPRESYDIVGEDIFYKSIEKTETKRSLLTGEKFTQGVNTPLCCYPSSETYWSM